jgi:hypothetical protein
MGARHLGLHLRLALLRGNMLLALVVQNRSRIGGRLGHARASLLGILGHDAGLVRRDLDSDSVAGRRGTKSCHLDLPL